MFSLLDFLFHLFPFTVSYTNTLLLSLILYIYIFTYLVKFVCCTLEIVQGVLRFILYTSKMCPDT